MIWTAIPTEKPVIAAGDSARSTLPTRSSANRAIAAPTSSVSAATSAGSAGERRAWRKTPREVRAMALVKVVTISTLRDSSEPTIVGTIPAHRPANGPQPAIAA
jgi:hypothetical protein